VSKEVVLSSLFVFLLNGFFEGCSDVKLEEEAAEILSKQEEDEILPLENPQTDFNLPKTKPMMR
jgi:hypothetical protein